ncbi:hypothetical protein TbrSNM41_02400 [Thermus brockianus]|uniref:Uncharacterized protein n=1 Tax=Thermus brockianus TaxID=56956 RepID=A0ABN6NDF2_THEBO|nr:hypothetical protein TbrSNM41_02400 [Thermus brockianus]
MRRRYPQNPGRFTTALAQRAPSPGDDPLRKSPQPCAHGDVGRRQAVGAGLEAAPLAAEKRLAPPVGAPWGAAAGTFLTGVPRANGHPLEPGLVPQQKANPSVGPKGMQVPSLGSPVGGASPEPGQVLHRQDVPGRNVKAKGEVDPPLSLLLERIPAPDALGPCPKVPLVGPKPQGAGLHASARCPRLASSALSFGGLEGAPEGESLHGNILTKPGKEVRGFSRLWAAWGYAAGRVCPSGQAIPTKLLLGRGLSPQTPTP